MKISKMIDKSVWQLMGTMLLIAAVDALTTELYYNLWVGGFRISLSVALLPVLLYLNPKVHPLSQTAVIMGLGLFARMIFSFGNYGGWFEALEGEYQTLFFEAIYGIIYYMFYYRNPQQTKTLWAGVILTADFFANTSELYMRFHLQPSLVFQGLPVLFLIASVRTAFATMLVLGYGYFRALLRREEHQKRYERLMLIASQLSAENYLMRKNMQQIESVMSNAYALYENLDQIDHAGAKNALNIAKDVHEIKKSYVQIMQGLSALTGTTEVEENMHFKDLLNILSHSLVSEWHHSEDLPLTIDCHAELVIHQHFLMLSVLRNLTINALEALKDREYPQVLMRCRIHNGIAQKRHLLIEVIDNGHGIKQKDIECLFEPGFSTRFSPTTGDIQRGLGLTLVKEIVENTFNGTLTVSSTEGVGTTFRVVIDLERIEKP